MTTLMRCLYCGHLQDEPTGIKECSRCGGELAFENPALPAFAGSYISAQMELDQVSAPAGQTVDRHLLVSLRTPQSVPSDQAAKTESGRPAISFHAVMDVSGSMQGDKIHNTRQALLTATRLLHEGDEVSITAYSNEPRIILGTTPVDKEVLDQVREQVSGLNAGGMTALAGGLDLGIQQAKATSLQNRLVLLMSDGLANVGETDLERIGKFADEASRFGMVISTLGVGNDYNEALMTEIAIQGRGRFYHVQTADQIVRYLTSELGEAADMAARDVRIRINLPKGTALIPLSAAYRSEQSEGVATISIGDIPTDLEVEIPLRLTVFAGKAGERLTFDGSVQYQSPAGFELAAPLNKVTVRFVPSGTWRLDLGVVKPVAERVAEQMLATGVLRSSRAYAMGKPDDLKVAEAGREKIREYFKLLGKEAEEKLGGNMDVYMSAIVAPSPVTKNVVRDVFQSQRFMKDPGKKKK